MCVFFLLILFIDSVSAYWNVIVLHLFVRLFLWFVSFHNSYVCVYVFTHQLSSLLFIIYLKKCKLLEQQSRQPQNKNQIAERSNFISDLIFDIYIYNSIIKAIPSEPNPANEAEHTTPNHTHIHIVHIRREHRRWRWAFDTNLILVLALSHTHNHALSYHDHCCIAVRKPALQQYERASARVSMCVPVCSSWLALSHMHVYGPRIAACIRLPAMHSCTDYKQLHSTVGIT